MVTELAFLAALLWNGLGTGEPPEMKVAEMSNPYRLADQ